MKKTINTETKRVDWFDERLYLTPDEKWVYSVNHILKARNKGQQFEKFLKQSHLMADKIANDAAKDGTDTHYLTELYDKGLTISNIKEDEFGDAAPRYNEFVWTNFLRYVYFMEKYGHEIKIDAIELSLASSKLDYGGSLDRCVQFRGEKMIWDIKTGGEYEDSEYQIAAYAELYNIFHPNDKIDSTAILYTNSSVRTEKDDWDKNGVIQIKGLKLKKMKRPYKDAYKVFKAIKMVFDDAPENRGKKDKRQPKSKSIPMVIDPKKKTFIKDDKRSTKTADKRPEAKQSNK
jgi:hypothetical protein